MGLETLIKHKFTQQDIAGFTATSRPTETTVLNDLRKSNKIHFKRKSILIRDVVNLDYF
jgi:CRP-like cAMP-binding protein